MKEILGPNQKVVFWRPDQGEVLVGLVAGVQKTKFNREALRLAVPGFGLVLVGINSQLKMLPFEGLTGRWICLAYVGEKETKNGSLRLFSVALLDDSEVEKKMAGVNLTKLRLSLGSDLKDPGQDEVPF